jgi:predicted nucleic acid-binding protein
MYEVLGRTPTGRSLAPRLIGADLVAPDLLDLEVASTLRRNVIRGHTTRQEAALLLAVLREWDIERISHQEIVLDSLRWWPNVSAYDAAYVAVAFTRGGTVMTVDSPLSRAPITDVVVENVRVGPPA